MISIVIPTYNRCDRVVSLLFDIYLQQGVVFEVIVIDDCSSDDTADTVRRDYPQTRLIVNESRLGPCVARNRGIVAALGSIVVGLDSDVSVPDHFMLAKVWRAFSEQPFTTGIAFRILLPDGITDDLLRWWHPVPPNVGKDNQFRTNYFSGTGYGIRRSAAMKAGLYPEILFMHYEEVVLSYRLLDGGGLIRYCPEISVLHHAKGKQVRSKVQVYYTPRNQVILALLCLPVWKCVAYLVPRLGYQLSKAVLGSHVDQFLLAMSDVSRRLPQILECRKPLDSSTFHQMRLMRMAVEKSK